MFKFLTRNLRKITGQQRGNLVGTITSNEIQATLETNRCIAQRIEKKKDILAIADQITWHCKQVVGISFRYRTSCFPECLEKWSLQSVIQDTRIYELILVLEDVDAYNLQLLKPQYRTAVQEFVEAVSFFYYCKYETILCIQDFNSMMKEMSTGKFQLEITFEDYLMGLADLTGELMRLAVRVAGEEKFDFADEIFRIVQLICTKYDEVIQDDNLDDKETLKLKHGEALKNKKKILNALVTKSK